MALGGDINRFWEKNFKQIKPKILFGNRRYYADKDILNRFQFAQLIAKVFELNASMISQISNDVLNQQAPRPMKSGLLTKKIESVLEIEPKSVETCLNKIRKQLLE